MDTVTLTTHDIRQRQLAAQAAKQSHERELDKYSYGDVDDGQ